jgi:hypothetical protein
MQNSKPPETEKQFSVPAQRGGSATTTLVPGPQIGIICPVHGWATSWVQRGGGWECSRCTPPR